MPGRTFNYLKRDDIVMPAEAFDRRITFWQRVMVADGMGGTLGHYKDDPANTGWQIVLTTWGHVEPWRGRELWRGMQIYPNLWERVYIRWRPDINIDASMRVTYGKRNMDIRSIYTLGEARKIIELLVEELQAAGSLH